MKISSKGRYGLIAMLDLAIHSRELHISLNSIAQRQGVSASYLEQVFSMLRKAGLISSIKGAQGGYSLSTKPDKISVGDILRALEGELTVTDQQEQGINSIQDCVRIRVWDQLNQHINDFVDSITLEDLVNEYNKQLSEGNYMYYI
ncbi:MAG: Rrf2 family transcriptional regulator [Caldicoprobacterales bacterium]|nr:Rrf2 family transcriptional regulator [Clostridia bacterium]MDI9512298.1 Rrf2 family transcriptional regulator [Bacillota bacterium]NLH57809.1 Rrf2 family transcriptional regulator [Clostridiales bacterium]